MPPKRKRVDADAQAPPTRSTRSSARTGTSGTTLDSGGASSVEMIADDGAAPPQKKTRNIGAKATSQAKTTKGSESAVMASSNDDEISTKTPLNGDEVYETKIAPKVFQEDAPNQPYTPQRAQNLFNLFADEDDHDVIGPEGLERLCTKADIPLDGVQPLILAWQLKSSEMGKFTRAEWLHGLGILEISSLPLLAEALRELEDLLIRDKQTVLRSSSTASQAKKKGSSGTREPYKRTRYWQYASDRKAAFQELYQFCFILAKPPQARNIDIETAMAFWSVLLTPRYPIIKDLTTFLTEKGAYKGANKDIWNMVYEFCCTVDPSLDNYEADGAWPSLLDDFVAWAKSRTRSSAGPVPAKDVC